MKDNTVPQSTITSTAPSDLTARVNLAIRRAIETNRAFFIVLLQIENMQQFRKRRPPHVVNGLMRELMQAVRMAVHPSQYVGPYRDGLAIVFEGVDAGHVDMLSRRLVGLTQNVIRQGHYNDLTSRWTDILYQFLFPNNPGILYSRVGWAIFPRDGQGPTELLRRAQNHVADFSSR